MVISLDIGGTNIRIAEVSKSHVTKKKILSNPRIQQLTVQRILDLISARENPKVICIATAGFEHQGLIQGSPNTSLNGVPLRKILQQKFRSKIYIQNDAHCATLAEIKYGAGKQYKNFIVLTLGTGIGGGIVIDKKLYLGQGLAGEVCDMIIDNGKTFEHLASGSAFKEIQDFHVVGRNLGVGLANLAHILDPQAFIIGGGFSNNPELFPIAQLTLNTLYPLKKIPIQKSKLHEDGGLIGAALLQQN